MRRWAVQRSRAMRSSPRNEALDGRMTKTPGGESCGGWRSDHEWRRSVGDAWGTRCSGRSRAPARLGPQWGSSMRWANRRSISTRRMGSCDSRFGLRGSTDTPKARLQSGAQRLPSRPTAPAENGGLRALPIPKVTQSPLVCALCCFPLASPALAARVGKQKRPLRAALNRLNSMRDFGAGEGIRTLDPNLGKVPEGPTPGYPATR
jgi:hypothetical protein